MMPIVTKRGRERAVDAAFRLVQHQLDRMWDALQEAHTASSVKSVTKVMLELNKIASLAGSARQGCNTWLSLQADNERAELAEIAAENAAVQARAVAEAPYADQVTVNEASGAQESKATGPATQAAIDPVPVEASDHPF